MPPNGVVYRWPTPLPPLEFTPQLEFEIISEYSCRTPGLSGTNRRGSSQAVGVSARAITKRRPRLTEQGRSCHVGDDASAMRFRLSGSSMQIDTVEGRKDVETN